VNVNRLKNCNRLSENKFWIPYTDWRFWLQLVDQSSNVK